MSDEELGQVIDNAISDETSVVMLHDDHLYLHTEVKFAEIVAIAELLKKEGRV